MEYILEPPSLTLEDRAFNLAETGATDEDIATALHIPVKRLQKRYRRQLQEGRAKGKHEMLGHLYKTAKSGSNTTATMFWVKSKCGWRDTGASAESTVIIRPVLEITGRREPATPDA